VAREVKAAQEEEPDEGHERHPARAEQQRPRLLFLAGFGHRDFEGAGGLLRHRGRGFVEEDVHVLRGDQEQRLAPEFDRDTRPHVARACLERGRARLIDDIPEPPLGGGGAVPGGVAKHRAPQGRDGAIPDPDRDEGRDLPTTRGRGGGGKRQR